MREHEEVQKMGHIVQRLVRNAIMQAVNQAVQKKTQEEAARLGKEVFAVWYPDITVV